MKQPIKPQASTNNISKVRQEQQTLGFVDAKERRFTSEN